MIRLTPETASYLQKLWTNQVRADATVAAGFCPKCGRQPERLAQRQQCDRCAAKQKAHVSRLREKRRAAGICRDCGRPAGEAGKARCTVCLAREAERRRERRRVMRLADIRRTLIDD